MSATGCINFDMRTGCMTQAEVSGELALHARASYFRLGRNSPSTLLTQYSPYRRNYVTLSLLVETVSIITSTSAKFLKYQSLPLTCTSAKIHAFPCFGASTIRNRCSMPPDMIDSLEGVASKAPCLARHSVVAPTPQSRCQWHKCAEK